MGGQALVQRLGDKDYSWNAVGLLIPDMIAAGLLGYAYACPDMIGGGQFGSFLGSRPDKADQELIVRSCQVHTLMPMMQFSVAPGASWMKNIWLFAVITLIYMRKWEVTFWNRLATPQRPENRSSVIWNMLSHTRDLSTAKTSLC